MTLRRIQNVAGPSHLNGQYLVNDPYEWRKIICKQIQERRKRADCKSKPYKVNNTYDDRSNFFTTELKNKTI